MVGWLIFWSLLNVVTPRDAHFDVLNYHILNGWSGWHGRLTQDLAPADLHSFFNPMKLEVAKQNRIHDAWIEFLGLRL